MENWQDELDKAREAGYKDGVTEGYKRGTADATAIASAVGYLTHYHDLMDILDAHFKLGIEKVSVARLMEHLEAIHAVRAASKVYIKDTKQH